MRVLINNLCEIADIISGQSPPSTTYNNLKKGLPFFQGKADFGITHPRIRMWCSTPKKIAYKNDILMSVRAPVGPVNIANVECCIGRGLCAIRSKKDIYYLYIYYFLKNNQKIIAKYSSGSTFKAINQHDLKKIKILIPYKDGKPDLLTQKRIAKVLSDAEKLIAKRKESISLLDEFLKATFLEMFGDPVRNEKGWETKTIEKLVKKEKYAIKRGPFGGALKKEIFVDDGYLVYEQYHALNNDFSFARYFIDEKKFQELKAFEVKPGDIIISCSGVYLGKLAIVPNNAKPGIINQALLKLSLDNQIISNTFFVFLFSHQNFKRKFFGAQRGGGIPNFPPMSEFKKFNFIYPPLPLQNQFAKIVEKTEAIKKQFEESLQELENLYGSLSQKAFKGELDLSKVEIEETEEESKEDVMEQEMEQEEIKKLNLAEFIKENFKRETFSFEELRELIDKNGIEYDYDKVKDEIFKSIDNIFIEQKFDEQSGTIKLRLKQ